MEEQIFREKMIAGEVEKLPEQERPVGTVEEKGTISSPPADASKLEDYVLFLEPLRRSWRQASPATLQDFNNYIEIDPSGYLTITSATQLNWVAQKDADTYLYSDKGVDHFNGDFEHKVTVKATTGGATAWVWMLANDLDDVKGLAENAKSFESVYISQQSGTEILIYLFENDVTTRYDDHILGLFNTTYYLTIKRDESGGTYGTLYLYVYFNPGRTTLLDVVSVNLHTSKRDFRYIYAFNLYNDLTSGSLTGQSNNLYST